VRASAVTPRKPQISEVVKLYSEIMSRAGEFYFSRLLNTLTALTSDLNASALQLTFVKAVSHMQKNFFSAFKVIVTTPGVYPSKPELATSYVFHSESFTEVTVLGGQMAEKAWSSFPSYVPTVYELACKSSQRV
jgi:hypothetical protein